MSAIAGLKKGKTSTLRAEIETLTRSVRHRGPNEQNTWTDNTEGIALGHVLLATTPEAERESQPVSVDSGRITLTADVRIDNRHELRQSLNCDSYSTSELTDPSLLALSYLKWGTKCTNYLVGDFSFAIWDKTEKVLFCARDPMGVRPFYYAITDKSFSFSSEIKSLISLPGFDKTINKNHLYAYLSGSYGKNNETFFRNVLRLPPGHVLKVKDDLSVKVERYWHPSKNLCEFKQRKDKWYEEKFRSVFAKSVKSNLRSNKETGILLSGGLDSSAVAVLAGKFLNESCRKPHTFSKVYPSLPKKKRLLVDEREYINTVLKKYNFKSHFVDTSKINPLRYLEEMVQAWGQPFHLLGQYSIFKILDQAGTCNVRNLLDGSEGDAVVGYGYDYFLELARENNWKKFEDLARKYSEHCRDSGKIYSPSKMFWSHGFEVIVDRLRRGEMEGFYKSAVLASRSLDISLFQIIKRSMYWVWPDRWRKMIDKLRNKEKYDITNTKPECIDTGSDRKSILDRSAFSARAQALQRSRMLTASLEGTDAIYAAHHIEARHPFYDRRVIEFCLSLPAEQRFRGGWRRSILRRALRGFLPGKVKRRLTKARVGTAIEYNLLRFDEDYLADLVLDNRVRSFVDREVVASLLERFRKPEQSSSSSVQQLMRVAVLSVWLRKLRNGKLEGPSSM